MLTICCDYNIHASDTIFFKTSVSRRRNSLSNQHDLLRKFMPGVRHHVVNVLEYIGQPILICIEDVSRKSLHLGVMADIG